MDEPAPKVCPGCEREVPCGAAYCPYCCGQDGRGGARRRGAFIGAIGGLMVGGVAAAIWSSLVGPENVTWGLTFGVVLAGMAIGILCGVLRQRGR